MLVQLADQRSVVEVAWTCAMRVRQYTSRATQGFFMAQAYNVAVVGATGAVGVEMLATLERRNFPVKDLRLFASERSVGKKLKFKGAELGVELLKVDVFKGIDIA